MSSLAFRSFFMFSLFLRTVLVYQAKNRTSHFEFVYEGLFSSYNESFSRTSIPTINVSKPYERDYDFALRYVFHINRIVRIGTIVQLLRYTGHDDRTPSRVMR